MSSFTPGPWRADRVYGWGSDLVILADGWPKPIATMVPHPDRYYTHQKRTIRGEEWMTFAKPTPDGDARKAEVDAELEANAYLLAAAPELYEALKMLLADIEDYQRINNLGGENNHSQVISRAALAKAEARS